MLFIYSFILRPSVSVLEAFQSTSPNGCIWWMRPGNLVQRLWVLLHPSHWCDKDWERARHQHVHLHRKVSFQEPSLPLDATCISALVWYAEVTLASTPVTVKQDGAEHCHCAERVVVTRGTMHIGPVHPCRKGMTSWWDNVPTWELLATRGLEKYTYEHSSVLSTRCTKGARPM